MLETKQLVLTNIEEDVLASLIRRQQRYLKESLEAIEARDLSVTDIKETLLLVEKNLRQARTFIQRSLTPYI